jgi:hypothetical protein
MINIAKAMFIIAFNAALILMAKAWQGAIWPPRIVFTLTNVILIGVVLQPPVIGEGHFECHMEEG